MSHPRALDEQQAIAAEQWFQDYERVGSFAAKARELGITPHTLRDTIRRVRNQDTRPLRRKLTSAELSTLIEHVRRETTLTGEQQSENADAM